MAWSEVIGYDANALHLTFDDVCVIMRYYWAVSPQTPSVVTNPRSTNPGCVCEASDPRLICLHLYRGPRPQTLVTSHLSSDVCTSFDLGELLSCGFRASPILRYLYRL